MHDIEIIVLDDEEDVSKVTSNALKDWGYVCYSYQRSVDALKHMTTSPVQVLVLDIDLGEEQTGEELIPRFREMNPGMIILMLTGEWGVDTAIRCMKAGAFDYILKPFEFDYLEEKMRQCVEKIRTDALSGIYFNTIVHDLKNPLQILTSTLELLNVMDADNPDERHRRILGRGYRAVNEINKMINSVLTIDKYKEGRFVLAKTPFRVAESMQEALSIFQPLEEKEEGRITVTHNVPENLVLSSDKNLFQHVIYNLVSNALRHGNDSPVEVGAEQMGPSVVLSVKNKGSFIEERHRNLIFNRFSQNDNNGVRTNMNFGLGLTFCKTAVDCMGGKIWVDSSEDPLETVFYVQLTP